MGRQRVSSTRAQCGQRDPESKEPPGILVRGGGIVLSLCLRLSGIRVVLKQNCVKGAGSTSLEQGVLGMEAREGLWKTETQGSIGQQGSRWYLYFS